MENMTRCQLAAADVRPVHRALAPMALAKPWTAGTGLFAIGRTFDGSTTVNILRRPPEAPS